MRTDEQTATEEARRAGGPTPADRLLERMAELIGARAGVQAVFGEPTTRGDLTVIPVARVGWGFGGGGGRADGPESGQASGSGGGGGVAADPVGYLEIGPQGATFRPIQAPYPSPLFLIASGLTAAIVLRALARLVRLPPARDEEVARPTGFNRADAINIRIPIEGARETLRSSSESA